MHQSGGAKNKKRLVWWPQGQDPNFKYYKGEKFILKISLSAFSGIDGREKIKQY
jgi:hypothetical protein